MNCELLVENYTEWLKNDFMVNCLDNSCHIITPFLRPDNDAIEIYVYKQPMNGYKITDEGSTFEYLFLNGVDIDNSLKRKGIIESVNRRTLTLFDGTDLYAYANNLNECSNSINNLIAAIQNLCCLSFTNKESSKTTFREDVFTFLQSKKINVQQKYTMAGYAVSHTFDFAVVRNKINIIEPMTSSSPNYANVLAERMAYRFNDVRKKSPNFRGIVVINDEEDIWAPDTLNIIKCYSDAFTGWKERDKLIDLIA